MHKVDFLTGLNNMSYLEDEYENYLKKNPTSYLIAIDFAKLKQINDNFGHQTGDECLKLFAQLGRKYFDDSLLIRRSGDEFVFVTHNEKEEIQNKLSFIADEIKKKHEDNIIPTIFGFNCGIKRAREDLKLTLLKADITMYYAKNEHCLVKNYDTSFYLKFQHSTEFIENIDKLYEKETFTYVFQTIYDIKNKKEKIKEIYTRNNNQTLFDSNHFNILFINHRFKKIDFINLEHLFKNYNHFFKNGLVAINIHFHTLFATEIDFCTFLKELVNIYNIDPNNIILSINVVNYKDSIEEIKNTIIRLKELGFKICLDNYSVSNTSTFKIFEVTPIDYIKVGKSYLEDAMHDERNMMLAQNQINTFLNLGTIPIFVNVETKEEEEFVSKLNDSCYVKGYLYSKEEKVK